MLIANNIAHIVENFLSMRMFRPLNGGIVSVTPKWSKKNKNTANLISLLQPKKYVLL